MEVEVTKKKNSITISDVETGEPFKEDKLPFFYLKLGDTEWLPPHFCWAVCLNTGTLWHFERGYEVIPLKATYIAEEME